MKLYYAPGACSLSPHIVANEAGIALELEKVDLGAKRTDSGADFLAINPKGYVPVLQLDSGEVLTEGPATSSSTSSIASHSPGMLRPMARWSVIGSRSGWATSTPSCTRASVRCSIQLPRPRAARVETALAAKSWLTGEQFTIADAYLFTVTNWASFVKVDLSKFPNLLAFQARASARSAVKAALAAEGLLAA